MTARIIILKSCAVILRTLGRFLDHYQLIMLILFFVLETGPHMRAINPYYHDPRHPCVYLGSRGLVEGHIPDCPLFVILNSNTGRYEP
tara:strand:- start:384 stop:647 length:264 start_codon:yes stop_codon:yes gene_type:complete